MIRVFSVILVIFSIQCSTGMRGPASEDPTLVQDAAKKYLSSITSPDYNKSTCGAVLSEVQSTFANIEWNAYSNKDLKSYAAETMNSFWQLRLAIHRRLGEVGKDCILQAREIFHTLRDGEDYLGEFAYDVVALNSSDIEFQKQPIPIYDRKAYPPYFVRPEFDTSQFKFQSGDVILSRGISFVSAIISQVSDNRSHFSHAAVVRVDPKTQVPSTIEAYVGEGTKEYDINYALKNENARLLVLRPKNPALGEKAAEFAMKAVNSRVPYDYKMNFKDYSAMSCVEVTVYAYDKASKGALKLPIFPAMLNLNNADFLQKMNLKRGALITPDDLESDPHFDLILDWRDYRLVRDSRRKDAVLSELMRWLGDLKYKFHDTPKSLVAKYVVHPARPTPFWPLVRGLTGAPNFDKELPKKTFGLLTVLDSISNQLLEELQKQDAAYILRHQRPMTNQQLRQALEKFRQEDWQKYYRGEKSVIHEALRPS